MVGLAQARDGHLIVTLSIIFKNAQSSVLERIEQYKFPSSDGIESRGRDPHRLRYRVTAETEEEVRTFRTVTGSRPPVGASDRKNRIPGLNIEHMSAPSEVWYKMWGHDVWVVP